jgi:hypothetical protein
MKNRYVVGPFFLSLLLRHEAFMALYLLKSFHSYHANMRKQGGVTSIAPAAFLCNKADRAGAVTRSSPSAEHVPGRR